MNEFENNREPLPISTSSSNGLSQNNIHKINMSSEMMEKSCGCQKNNESSMPKEKPSYVYAIGRIQPRFPKCLYKKEFAQAVGRSDTTGLTDGETLRNILAERQSRYLARKMCWVFTVDGVNTYIVLPRDPIDYELLINALRPAPRPTDIDVIIGVKGPIAPVEMCNGLSVPIVVFDHMYSFDVDGLIKSIPRPEKIKEEQFTKVAEEVFHRVIQLHDNAGNTDEQRAVNYLSVRYDQIYSTVAYMHGNDFSLTSIEAHLSRLSGAQKIVNVILSFTNRKTDIVEKYSTRVDVTEEFPFLVTALSPYYDKYF